MTTKTFSLIGLVLLLQLNNTHTAQQKDGQTTPERVKQAFAVIGFYKNMPVPTPIMNKNEQSLALLEKSLVFNAPVITERYTQPTKFVYNPKTGKFESQLISLTDVALKA